MAQEELQESKLTKAGGRKPTHGCNYPMVGWPSVILTPMGPSLNLTREGTSRPSLRSSLSLSLSLSLQGCPELCLQESDMQNGSSHLQGSYLSISSRHHIRGPGEITAGSAVQ